MGMKVVVGDLVEGLQKEGVLDLRCGEGDSAMGAGLKQHLYTNRKTLA